jgi:hypothetical protein
MYENSERTGPQLSSENDNRITPIGRFMRKTRLDEFPQFIVIGVVVAAAPLCLIIAFIREMLIDDWNNN